MHERNVEEQLVCWHDSVIESNCCLMVRPIDLRERDQVGEAWTLGTRPADPRTAAMPLHLKRDTTKPQCAKARGGLRQSSCERVVVLIALGHHCRRPLHLRRDDILRQQIAKNVERLCR